MDTHVSLLEVFQEMTRLKEENWALKKEIERVNGDWKSHFMLCKDSPPPYDRYRTPETVREMLTEHRESIWANEVISLGFDRAAERARCRLGEKVAMDRAAIGYAGTQGSADTFVSLWVLKTNPCEWSKP
jgi:hypothetical protein